MTTQYVACRVADSVAWARDLSGTVPSAKNRVLAQAAYNGTNWGLRIRDTLGDTQIAFVTLTNATELCTVIPIDANHILVCGHVADAGPNDELTFWRIKFGNGNWSVSENKEMRADMHARFINSFAFDSNGTLYLATFQPLTGAPVGSVAMNSAIIRITNTDLLAVRPRISSITYSHYDVNVIQEYGGEVYLFGMERLNNKQFRRVIWKWPNKVVYRSQRIQDLTADSLNYSIRSVFWTPRGIMFITRSTYDDYDSVSLLTFNDAGNEVVREHAAFLASPGETVANESVGMLWGVPHVFRRTDKKLYRTHHINGRGNLPGTGSEFASLRLSEYGGNTPLIPKTAYAVTLELSEAIPAGAGNSIEIQLNGTTVATMDSTHGTEKEFLLSPPVTASAFKPVLRAPRTCQWQGYLKRFSIRYIPNPLRKKAWSFAILVTNGLKLLDGRRESRSAQTMLADLETAWRNNEGVSFTDVDGQTYNVIVTDWKGRQPLQANKRERREWIVPIELLEV